MHKLFVRVSPWLALLIGIVLVAGVEGRAFRVLSMQEPTIADMHAAMQAGELTCRALVHIYIDRIEAYDKKGPALNAIVMLNPQALATADALDAQAEPPLAENPSCQKAEENGRRLRDGVLKAMDAAKVEALVYPSWNNPPRLIGDLNTPHGNNSPLLSPPTGFPALTVPMGFVRGSLPAGLQFLGRAWSEPMLIQFAYAYEQATKHRRPPASTPPLP